MSKSKIRSREQDGSDGSDRSDASSESLNQPVAQPPAPVVWQPSERSVPPHLELVAVQTARGVSIGYYRRNLNAWFEVDAVNNSVRQLPGKTAVRWARFQIPAP